MKKSVPFEDKFIQVFEDGMLFKGIIASSKISKVDDEIKQLDYYIEYEFTPAKRKKKAMLTVHLKARVQDL